MERMIKLKKELNERMQKVEDKKINDIAIYGVPLGNKILMDKVDAKLKQIAKLEKKMEREKISRESKWKLPKYDQKILDAIRNNNTHHTTSSVNTFRFDNRYCGSAKSRRDAKR